jgi:hypothetical protein
VLIMFVLLEGKAGLSEEPIEEVRTVLHPAEPVLDQATGTSMVVTALFAMLPLRWARTDSTALSSEVVGAAGSRSASRCGASGNVRVQERAHPGADVHHSRLSQIRMIGAFPCWWAAVSRVA